MPGNKSRFVLLCQQTLVVAVVAAVAAPAADVVSLDIVAPPSQGAGEAPSGSDTAAGGVGTSTRSVVASATVRPTVSTVPFGTVSKAGLRALRPGGTQVTGTSATTSHPAVRLTSASTSPRTVATPADALAALSAPLHVGGLATVGVTWAKDVHVPDGDITVTVRTRRGSTWSTWRKVPYHQDEGPDPSSAEGRAARPGTDPVYVGRVDDVQVKAVTGSGRAPRGMKLALVDPGQAATATEDPAIDTGALDGTSGTAAAGTATTTAAGTATGSTASTSSTASAALTAARVTSKPTIYSRAQWGADERMRDRSSLHYGEVHGGFVHHTVNANTYTRAQVPAIIRGIYAFHTQSRGWSDIGYNFLVDRFGRIWEGRYGGVDRPVVGAHTLGYNDDSFAMSAIGNYEIARPPAAVVTAFGKLFAWKLSLHGVRASSTHQWVEKSWLHAISGHRDVGQTACPGKYLYAKIPQIRTLAARYQRSWSGRLRDTDLAGGSSPDLIVRDRTTRRAYVVRTAGAGHAVALTRTDVSFPHADLVLNAGDWDGDGHGDVITRSARSGQLFLFRGNGTGHFAAPRLLSRASFAKVRMLSAVGDYTGDGHPDLLGQRVGWSMRIYPGRGLAGLRHSYVAHAAVSGSQQLGVGLWTGDGSPDSVVRRSNGALTLYPGNGPGGLTGGTRVGSIGPSYDWVLAVGDLTGDGRTDLVARGRATGRLYYFPGSASGFGARRALAGGMSRFDLAG